MSESSCWYALADAQKASALWTWQTFRVWEALIAQAQKAAYQETQLTLQRRPMPHRLDTE